LVAVNPGVDIFNNAGTLTEAGGNSSSTLAVSLFNTGLIDVSAGTMVLDALNGAGSIVLDAGTILQLEAGGTSSAAISGASATLALAGGTFDPSIGLLAGVGALEIFGGTVLNIGGSSGTVTAATAVSGDSSLTLASGADLTLSGALSFESAGGMGDYVTGPGTLTTAGMTTIASHPPGAVVFLGGGINWVNGGAVHEAGKVWLNTFAGDAVTIVNEASASFDMTADTASILAYKLNSGTDNFSNAGTLAKIGGTATSVVEMAVSNTGLIYVGSGTLEIGSLSGAGSLVLNTGTTLQIDNGGNSSISVVGSAGTLAIAGGTFTTTVGALAGAGELAVYGGELQLTGASGSLAASISIKDSGTVLAASGTDLTLSGPVSMTSMLSVASGTQLTLSGVVAASSMATLSAQSGGNLIASGALSLTNYGALDAAVGSTFTVTGALIVGLSGSAYNGTSNFIGQGTLTTAGTTTINGDSSNNELSVAGGITWVNGGTVNDFGAVDTYQYYGSTITIVNQIGAYFNLTSDDATLIQSNGSTCTFMNAGMMAKTAGGGVSVIDAALVNSGVVSAASGTLQLQSAVSNSGTLLAISGGILDLSLATLANLSGTTLTGGSYEVDAGSVIELTDNSAIATESASITLSGVGSEIQALDTSSGTQTTLDSQLSAIGVGGALSLLDGRNFSAVANGGSFTDNGVLNMAGVDFTATTLTISAGATLTGSGNVTGAVVNQGSIVASGGVLGFLGTLTNSGTIDVTAGALSLVGTATNNGTIEAASGIVASMYGVDGTGTLEIGATGTLSLMNGALAGQVVDFLAGTGALDLNHPLSFFGQIAGFGAGDIIDLTKPSGLSETGYNYADGVLTVMDGSATVASLNFVGNYNTTDFALNADGHGGTVITFV
jgi:hypothetical protein